MRKNSFIKPNIRACLYGFFAWIFGLQLSIAQPPTPAEPQTGGIAYSGLKLNIGNGTVIENGVLAFAKGKFVYVGSEKNYVLPQGFTMIRAAAGGWAYPGFILPNTTLGIGEIESVRATLDMEESGNINPNARSLMAYNTDSEIIPTVRRNGILMAQICPRGGLVSGTSSVVQLDAWNWQDASVLADEGVHIEFPAPVQPSGWWAEPGPMLPNAQYNAQIEELDLLFQAASQYYILSANSKIKAKDLRLEALKGLFSGRKQLYLHAESASQIQEAIQWANKFKIPKIVIVGGDQAHLAIDILKKNNIPVILNRLHSLPETEDQSLDLPYRRASLLSKAGILFCLAYNGDMEAMGSRNLPFVAGTAAAFGLSKAEALSAITLNTAKILRIDAACGSLEVGKDATFFISKSDALDMATNQLNYAYIQGRLIELDGRQERLQKKFDRKKTGK